MILTQPKLISQERLDLEDFLNLLSGATTDSQYFISSFWAPSQYILKGFSVSGLGGPSPATISMSGATLINPNNTGGFSWFSAQSGASNITVALNSGVRNYIELQLSNVDGTPLTRAFWDPSANAGAGAEFSQTVNTITSVQISAVALQGGFSGSANSIPIAIVDTDVSNNIKLILDKRPMLFRLINPQTLSQSFAWNSQTEPTTAITLTGVSGSFVAGETITLSGGATATVVSYSSGTIQAVSFSNDSFAIGNTVTGGTSAASGTVATVSQAFSGGDKDITNLRDVLTALMTEIKRVKGTSQWFNSGYGSLAGVMNQIDSVLTQSTTANKASWSWNSNVLSLTDSNGTPASTDTLAVLRILGSSVSCNLRRQDGQAGTSTFSIPSGSVLFVQLPSSGAANYSGVGTGATNYQITTLANYVVSDQNYWLAYAEGANCYVRGQGFLESGETQPISNPLPSNFVANIGFTDQDSPANYSSNIRGVSNESLVSRLGILTDAAGDYQEDRSAYMRSDGTCTWTVASHVGTLTFGSDLVLEILNTKSGTVTTHTILAAGSPLTLNAGESAYITINRTPGGNAENVALTRSSVTPIPAQVQSTKDVIVLFKNYQTGGGTNYLFCPLTKQVFQPNDRFNLGSTVSQNLYSVVLGTTDANTAPSYSSNIRGTAGDSFVTRIGVNTDGLGDQQEDRSAYFRSDSPIVWSGTQLSFTSNIVLEIINTKNGTTTTHTILAANSPITVNNGESVYISISRTATSESVTPVRSSVTPIPAQTQANKDIFVLCKCLQSSGGTSYLYLPFMKSLATPGQSLRIGQGGGGSSSSTGINYISNPDAEGGLTGWSTYSDNQTVTISIASPAVFTSAAAHGYSVGQKVVFTTTGALPTGLTASQTYYVSSVPSSTTYQVSSTLGGSSVNTSGTQSGTHTQRPLTPITATGGSVSGLTLSQTTTSPLRGSASFLLSQSNSTIVAGQGVSYDFTIDNEDQAKVLGVQVDFNASSTFSASSGQVGSDSDLEFFLIDKTNNVLLPISPNVITANGSNNYTFKGTFQTSNNSTSYRLVIHAATINANSTGWAFKFDNVILGPQVSVNASAVTDWQSYTPTGAWTTNVTYIGKWRRVGDSMEIDATIAVNGTPGTGNVSLTIPSGYTIDTSKLTSTDAPKTVGTASLKCNANYYNCVVWYASPNSVQISAILFAAASTNAYINVAPGSPDTFVTGDRVFFKISVPISGWGSTITMSDSSDTRVVAARYMGTPTGTIASTFASASSITFPTLDYDTHGAWNGTTYTVPVSGKYAIKGQIQVNCSSSSGLTSIAVYKNGTEYAEYETESASNATMTVSYAQLNDTLNLVAGDQITFRVASTLTSPSFAGGTTSNKIAIERLSGPSAIAATETISASAVATGSQSTPASTQTVITYGSKDYDTHGALNTSTGVFTCPAAGKYRVECMVPWLSPIAGTTVLIASVAKNGSIYREVQGTQIINANTQFRIGGSITINCNAGDTMAIYAFSGGATNSTGATGSTFAWVTFTRVGN